MWGVREGTEETLEAQTLQVQAAHGHWMCREHGQHLSEGPKVSSLGTLGSPSRVIGTGEELLSSWGPRICSPC